MKFRTELQYNAWNLNQKLGDELMFVGSCFADNIGNRFQNLRLNVLSNPLGIWYNPISLFQGIKRIIHPVYLNTNQMVEQNELVYSWLHHGSRVKGNYDELVESIYSQEQEAHQSLGRSKVLFITLGSAWAYKHILSNQLVANCHKITANEFEKTLINSEQIEKEFESLYKELIKLNSSIKIVFTVSPVRYVRDGLIENNRSKAELIKATHNIVAEYENCYYLPAYEWIIDDLRDYRFYKEDMVHPNKIAVDYVWERLIPLVFSPSASDNLKALNRFISGSQHRPINPNSKSHQNFLSKLKKQGEELMKQANLDLQPIIDSL